MRLYLPPTAGGGGGATDHGALTGLSDDDHGQYLLKTGLREWDEQGSTPSTPASTKWLAYFKSDGFYTLEDDGTEERLAKVSEIPTVPDEFTDLTDTPANYTSQGGFLVRVNVGETALETVTLSAIDHGDFGGLTEDDHTQYLLATGLREWDEQGTDPSTPAASKWALYFKSGGLYYIDDAGSVTGPLGTGGGGSAAWESSAGEFKPDTGVISSGDLMLHRARETDGASAIAHKFTNANSLATSGAKIAAFYSDDGTTEKAYLDQDGALVVKSTGASGGGIKSVNVGDLDGYGIRKRSGSDGTVLLEAVSVSIRVRNDGTVISTHDLGIEPGERLFIDGTASNPSAGDSYFSKSASTGGNFSEFYDGTETRRDDGTDRRYLASRGVGLYTAIGDTHPVVELDADGVHWGPGGGSAVDFSLVRASGELVLSGLPTSDPGVVGALWDDSGTVKISQ